MTKPSDWIVRTGSVKSSCLVIKEPERQSMCEMALISMLLECKLLLAISFGACSCKYIAVISAVEEVVESSN